MPLLNDSPLYVLKNNVMRFFCVYVNDYIMGDLRKLGQIDPDSGGLGACAVPTAMAIISGMDLLGFLLSKSGRTGQSDINISSYLNMKNLSDERIFPLYYDKDTIEKIVHYRHGMMHHFFPKFKGKFAGICKDFSNPNLFISFEEILDPGAQSLNVCVLQKDFENSILQVETILSKSDDRDLFLDITLKLKDLEFYLSLMPQQTTTVMPGTPQNPRTK